MISPARPRRAAASRSIATTAAQAGSPGSDLSDLPEDSKPKIMPSKSPRKAKPTATTTGALTTAKVETDDPADAGVEDAVPSPKKAKGKAVAKRTTSKVEVDEEVDEKPKKKARVSKASIFPPADLDPSLHPPRKGHQPVFTLPDLPAGAARNGGIVPDPTQVTARPMLLGAHTSIAGGPATALLKAGMLGANGLAMFVKSQRQWKSKDYEEEAVERFRALMKPKEEGGLGYPAESILVHGSYLINLGNPDTAKWQTSYECFVDDLKRCHQLGVKLYNWHPGSTVGACTKEESFASIAKAINQAHKEVPEVITVIENMANAGSNIVGTAFTDLKSMIDLVDDKSRVRVCIDTCHTFAAGYDIRTPETFAETMKKFEAEVGWDYLAGVHLNDSKKGLASCKDLHENIGLGEIGLTAFRLILRDPHFAGIPIILETPLPEPTKGTPNAELSVCDKEIELLYRIQAIEDDEWEKQKDQIAADWRVVRDKLNPPKEKVKKPAAGKKGKKGKKDEEEDDEDEEDD